MKYKNSKYFDCHSFTLWTNSEKGLKTDEEQQTAGYDSISGQRDRPVRKFLTY